jgi:membrane-associated protease RseP (regulator of RpoE activity)
MVVRQFTLMVTLAGVASMLALDLPAQNAPKVEVRPQSEVDVKSATKDKNKEAAATPQGLEQSASLFELKFGMNLAGRETGEIVVEDVRPKSGAAEAGVKKGDIVTAIEGHSLRSSKELARYVAKQGVGSSVALTLLRDGSDLDVLVGERLDLLGLVAREDNSKRAYAWSVASKSPAAEAGIRRGDLFLEIGERKTPTYELFVEHLKGIVQSTSPGDVIPVAVVREGKEQRLKLVRGEVEALPAIAQPEVAPPESPAKEQTRRAIAVLHPLHSPNPATEPPAPEPQEKTVVTEKPNATVVEKHVLPPIGGVCMFVPVPDQIQVRLELSGLSSGQYVASVHEFGDIADVLHGSAGLVFGVRRSSQPLGLLGNFRPDVNGAVVWIGGHRALDLDNMLGRAVIISRVTPSPNGPQYMPIASGVIGIANPERVPLRPGK